MMMQQMKDYLRKLIKYEESLGVDVHQKDYFDNLYRKTTASFRAKLDAEEDNGLRKDGARSGSSTADRENNLKRKAVVGKKQVGQNDGGFLQQGVKAGVLRDQKQEQKPQKPNTKEATSGCARMTSASCNRRDAKPASATEKPSAGTSSARASRATEKLSNPMWIRPRSKTPHAAHHTRMDPVQLYQYYQHEWDKFKTNLPGECNRSELRWQIRHKLLGEQ